MSTSRVRPRPLAARSRPGERSQALVIVLAMVAIVSILVVAFFAAVRFDRVATASYGESLNAEQLGLGGLQVVVGQLQREMSKDTLPDTGGSLGTNTLYTNIPAGDMVPQPVGTNSAMPSLLKISTNANFYTGTLGNGPLEASSVSTTTPALNNRLVSLARWNHAYLGTFPSNSQVPYWVLMSRSGLTNGTSSTFGNTAANSVNNPNLFNTNYIIGRFAYAVYDEGGLLDINAAGYSTNSSAPTSDQIQVLKGTLAGADLTQVGVDPAALVAWRNASTGTSATSYLNYVTNTAATNGFLQVASGDRTFFSRQDLIKAAQSGTAGLTTSALTNLATFTRESVMPSWGPSTNAPSGGVYNYAANANVSTAAPFSSTSPNPNRFIARVRFANGGTVTDYHSSGAAYTYMVQVGDALVQHRFPLDRLNWLGSGGPAAGGTAASIQACFGLKWATANASTISGSTYSVWQYVGPTGSTEQSSIETLDQVAAENPPREPNFFELLQAGILNGSLGVSGDVNGSTTAYSYQYKNALQIFRIGASIVNQYSIDCFPRVIEYNQSGSYWQAVGTANLPSVNLGKFIDGASEVANTQGAVYYLAGLWNPTQTPSTITRPTVRLHLQGSVDVGNEWGNYSGFNYTTGGPSYHQTFNSSVQLSSSAGQGVNGFTTPNLLLPTDVNSGSLSSPGATGNAWTQTPAGSFSLEPTAANQYVGYRFPDFMVSPITTNASGTYVLQKDSVAIPTTWSTTAYGSNWQNLQISATGTLPVQCTLEYQDASGNWVPYSFSTGLNDSANTWANGAAYLQGCSLIQGPNYFSPPTFSPIEQSFSGTSIQMTSDPRSLRFGPWGFIRNTIRTGTIIPDAPNALFEPLWDAISPSPPTNSRYLSYGYGGGRHASSAADGPNPNASNVPLLFGNSTTSAKIAYYPAQLARNNQVNCYPYIISNSSYNNAITGYADNDGIQRIADSGLFTGSSSTNLTPSAGNPFQRTADLPVILNRAFNSVAEMGYTFRDDPWHSLDFFSANSADSGLLDLFSVREDPPIVTAGQTVRAGRLNLNTKNPAVLAAMLSGVVLDPINKTTLSSAAANALAADIIKATSVTPLVNKDQLVTRLGPSVTFTASPPAITDPLSTSDFASTDDQKIKTHREAYVRALADVGQTRTWNLMIDLIAQSGKYPPSATDLSQFVVTGERRYWLHVAIDRLTGKVISQQLEQVSE